MKKRENRIVDGRSVRTERARENRYTQELSGVLRRGEVKEKD